ncbi:mannose-6-phosphate isomerase [Cylindrobasidium torrendii FP15055 ss-10]|uniref:Mannose-6-phosphate isomerase n=1 Tax=Cylindrobasidium torrendii FP15055 ss-10 TaxID=1314674 RepID=A0A0D7B9J7_9AGAR|nr:mannose-6-phosphate isomerase [Cylindrobasidium torrendii FP15055 ss-10]
MASPVFKIVPTAQQYDWGKVGSASKVAQLAAAAAHPGFQLQDDKPYAELWMGTHPTSPSTLPSGSTLADVLKGNPGLIGDSVSKRFPKTAQGDLPFLFKVLSIEKALSIQTHPDKSTAEQLHAQLPDIYKDDNHKPELALALTPFQALCGFPPLPDIAKNFSSVPELAALIPPTILETFLRISSSSTPTGQDEKNALKDLFAALMTAETSTIQRNLDTLIARYTALESPSPLESLVIRLNSQFPGDIGVFCAFILNYVTLSPGEAIFLGAGEPHAYVAGDIIECMANSDNVIRAGLTPKLRDIPNLVSGLTYNCADAQEQVVRPTEFAQNSLLYDPPIPEFSVVRVSLDGKGEESHRAVDGPSIVLITEGKGTIAWGDESLELGLGDVAFVGANTPVTVKTEDGLIAFRALVEASYSRL